MKKIPGEKVRAAGILLIHVREEPLDFLLLRHPDRWDLPKGHCEPGESFVEAALRETVEETGIPSDEITLDDSFCFETTYNVTYKRWGDTVFEKQVQYFLGFLREKPDLILTEHEDSRWFRWSPPHHIQRQTIDPLLHAVEQHLKLR